MKKGNRRFPRPLGCLLCLLLLLGALWLLRLLNGPPGLAPVPALRQAERRALRAPGEVVTLLDDGASSILAATWREGTLYTYLLYCTDLSFEEGHRGNRFAGGYPWRDTASGASWGCLTPSSVSFDFEAQGSIRRTYHLLLAEPAPEAVRAELRLGGTLLIETEAGEHEEVARSWKAEAERENPYAFVFDIVVPDHNGSSYESRQILNAVANAPLGSDGAVTAWAEVVFYDAAGNEWERRTFDPLEG